MPNRLAKETSPYLQQHADNPVDWYPWAAEALDRARRENRPILLSIGYSACHWCHVMAHESFEDEETARLMNERFVNIKVDREEMPDVDQLYQQALQLQGESGGWPLTMFLTSEAVPFFGGTYFPKRAGMGRPSFQRLLVGLSDAYRTQPDAVSDNARQFREGLQHLQASGRQLGESPAVQGELVDGAAARLAQRMDRHLGGIEGAPKFPNPTALELLLRAARRAAGEGAPQAADLLHCVTVTLTRMAEGGIYDQLGGGFARYSTDSRWLVPHFEKMLYDNAQLLRRYAEAYQLTGDPLYPRVIRETAAWIERELRDPEGGLYTAMDADSEGVEGKYFVWTPAEVEAALGAEDAALVERCLGVVEGGNWRDPHGHGPEGTSILHVTERPADAAERERLDGARARLLQLRGRRVPPGTDDKILASSNGLAITGLAEAGRILGAPALLEAARRTASFVLERMRDHSGRLCRTYKRVAGGPSGASTSDPSAKGARLPGTLDDHAFVAEGLITLYEATGEARWLEAAHALTRIALELFYDPEQRTFFLTAATDPGLIERPASSYDHAVPSGLSVTLKNLTRLGAATGELEWLAIVETVLAAHQSQALRNPFAWANLLNALDLYSTGATELVLAGDRVDELERSVAAVYLPNRFLVRSAGAPPLLDALVKGKGPVDGRATAYVCRDHRCEAPETDPARLKEALERA